MLTLDFSMARAFVAALTGSPDTVIVIQTADDTPAKRSELSRVLVGRLSELREAITQLNSIGAAIWIQINDGRRGARNVTALRACFVDDDGKSPLPPILAAPPSIVVQSSSGLRNRHYYWLLETGEELERFTATQKHLIAYYDTDKSIHNLDRVMRLPGTWHMKGSPTLVQLLHTEPRARYTLASLAVAHPLPEASRQQLLAEPKEELYTEEALASAKRVQLWLLENGLSCVTKSPIAFLLDCPFNATHGRKFMIRVQPRGGLWAGCWHDSCGGNTNRWSAFRDRIGGWRSTGGFTRGDHTEIAHRLIGALSSESEAEPITFAGALWQYDASGVWKQLDESQLYKRICAFAGAPLGKRVLHINDSAPKGAVSIALHLSAENGASAIETAPFGIAFSNGFLAAIPNGMAFMPSAPENYQILGLPYSYDANARCPIFLGFLESCFTGDADAPEKIALLQEFIGLCLVGCVTRFAKALVLHGAGANGKSVLISIIRALFPARFVAAVKPQNFGSDFSRAWLASARVNLVAEMPEANILSTDAFNAIITGDAIEARNPYGRPFLAAMKAGHIFSANRLPATTDQTAAFWRRLAVVPFNRRFEGANADLQLADRIISNDLPGIAVWAAQGAARALGAGEYTNPPSAVEAKDAWQHDADPVTAFITDACAREGQTQAMILYEAFTYWATRRGHKAMSLPKFSQRMKEIGLPGKSTKKFNTYPVTLTRPVGPLEDSYLRGMEDSST